MSPGVRARYADTARRFVELAEGRFEGVETFVVHADCHRGNLLRGTAGWFFLDFDDMARAPAVQDVWLLLPGRRADCEADLEAMLSGYEQFRPFPRETLGLIEVLRGLRYIRYAAWIASRWEDPSFPRAFPYFGTDAYWEGQFVDLREQTGLLLAEDGRSPWES
jgi:Ser/Thr protein kinase RdoA (MazF antagonist)